MAVVDNVLKHEVVEREATVMVELQEEPEW